MKNHNENDKYSIYCMIKFGEVPQLVTMVKNVLIIYQWFDQWLKAIFNAVNLIINSATPFLKPIFKQMK